jgi:nucleoside-diphosphate-sugar epimerase
MVQKPVVGVFGGSGYIGSSIAKHLTNYYSVKLFDLKEPKSPFPDMNFSSCDIRDYSQVEDCIKDLDVIIHTAIIQIPLINEQKRLGFEVNYLGTQNLCEATQCSKKAKGLILAGTWHTIGELNLSGVINEEFGFRPDMVEERAKLYALSKIAQESIVRYYAAMSEKTYGIIRMGTVLGEGMPEKTAANIFIERGLKGQSITPYKQSMYRPMLYVDISDVCKSYELFISKILCNSSNTINLSNSINVYYPEPITILDLALMVKQEIMKQSNNHVNPPMEIIDSGQEILFKETDKNRIKVDVAKALKFFEYKGFKSPRESIADIIKQQRLKQMPLVQSVKAMVLNGQ